MNTKLFQIVAISSNTNDFGLHGVVIVARYGLSFEFGASQGAHQPKLTVNAHVEIDFVPDCEIGGDAVACFDWSTIRLHKGERFTVEIPRSLKQCPKKVLKAFWTEPANTQNKASFKRAPGTCAGEFGV